MSCKVCDFFEKSKETKEKIEVVNNAILRECKYKDIVALLRGFRNDTKLNIPSSHFINKHKDNCLNGVKPTPINIRNNSNNLKSDGVYTKNHCSQDVETQIPSFKFTDYSQENDNQMMTDKMKIIVGKLIDIADYQLDGFKENLNSLKYKEPISCLKIVLELIGFEPDNPQKSKNPFDDFTEEQMHLIKKMRFEE